LSSRKYGKQSSKAFYRGPETRANNKKGGKSLTRENQPYTKERAVGGRWIWVGLLLLLIAGAGCTYLILRVNQQLANIVEEVTPDELLTRINEGQPIAVYFFSATCPHCREAGPRIARAARRTGATVVKLDLTKYPDVSQLMKLNAVPTLYSCNHGRCQQRVVGLRTVSTYVEFLKAQ
jgi:thiol-disulfide isomerase/thioredoxin